MYGQVCDVRALLFVPKHKRLVCSLKLLHPDSGDPSGVRWSVSRVQPSQLMQRLRAISLSSTMFHTFFFGLQTDLPCKKKKKNSTNNLGVVSCHSSSAKQSQVELWERAERHLTLSRPVCHTGEWQNSNKASWSSQGLSFTHLISDGFRCSPDYSAFC